MASAVINFPASTEPSINPTENGGRLINAYSEVAPPGSRSPIIIRRVPGLTNIQSMVGIADYRGSVLVGDVLYIANGALVYTVSLSGGAYSIAALSGALPGTGLVMMKRNMRSPTPQILIWHSAGLSQISSGTVSDFSDPDLPAVNSLEYMDGYFLFTSADGRSFSTAVNDDTIAGTDFTTAEANPDGLVRGVAYGRDYLLMGTASIEFWSDAGNPTGFPFSRAVVLTMGLAGTWAVAGQESGFTGNLMFVANDRKVYGLSGYTPAPVSTPYIESLLEAIDDLETLEASVYSVNGRSVWVLTSPTWTLEYDQTNGKWSERQSIGQTRWRAQGSVNAFNRWLTFERGSNEVYIIDPTAKRENGEQLVWEARSNQVHRFPGRFVVNRASFDMVYGPGIDRGISPIETDPVVSISYSDDGGRSFSNPVLRHLGTQGENVPIDIFRAGLTGRQGRQWRLQVADPVEVSLMGGAMDVEARAA